MAISETTEFYLEVNRPEKALALVAKGDTALARFDRCPDEAFRMFRKSDSLYFAQGKAINTVYINNNMMAEYKALQAKQFR